MHSYVIYNKLASLYVCFAMLHTTLHNETEIINRLQNQHAAGDQPNFRNFAEEHSFDVTGHVQHYRSIEEKERKIFDMIVPQYNEDILLWKKTGNYVMIPYTLDASLSASQQLAIPGVLRSIEASTCIRFAALPRPCGGGAASGGDAKLCFRAGRERAAHLGRRPGGSQPVTLASEDGPYWVLHLVGHVLGLPHPHACFNRAASTQDSRNMTRSACVPSHCPWQRFDPGSALQLTPEELGAWGPPRQVRHLNSASDLLALWRTRRAARPSHWDLLALHDLYRCWEGRPRCPPLRCRHGGFGDSRCRCVCPHGFTGDDCGVRAGPDDSAIGGRDCVRHVDVDVDLRLSSSGLPKLGSDEAVDQCVVRVRTSSQRLRILVTTTAAESRMSLEHSAVLYAEALSCSVKMYAFQIGEAVRTFCILDYLGDAFWLNVAGNFVDVLFRASPSHSKTRTLDRARLVIRSADALPQNSSVTAAATSLTSSHMSTSSSPIMATPSPVNHTGRGHMRSMGSMPSVNLLILPPILFALMGFNFLVVFCIKKYWEFRYGTAGIYRGTEGSDWMDQEEEEEPEDYTIKVEYSDSFDAIKPGWAGMNRETSFPQAEMTDLELFRSMYGVPAAPHPHPDDTDDGSSRPARVPAVSPEEESRTKTDKEEKQLSKREPPKKTDDAKVTPKEKGSPTKKTDANETEKRKNKTPAKADNDSPVPPAATSTKPAGLQPSSSLEGKASDSCLKSAESPSRTRKRVSFSDDIGEPLHVHSDAPSKKQGAKQETSAGSKKTCQTKTAAGVCVTVPFSGDAPPTSTAGDDSDSDTEESSCCDTSSSSSYHEDDDDLKKTEPGLFHGLKRCFQRKNNDSSGIQ